MKGRDDFNLQEAFEIARLGMSSLFLANGGALTLFLTAMLATTSNKNTNSMLVALVFFVGGVILAILTMICGYRGQRIYGNHYATNCYYEKVACKKAEKWVAGAFYVACGSLVCFIMGSIFVYCSI